ncbi:MAG: PPC domain-containing protein [Treponema sp.]|nr:PPC domain-containing protein [Treponema sp.]
MKRTHIFLALSFFVAVYLSAQSPQELYLEAPPVHGILNPGDEIWYSVRTLERGIITVEISGDLDTFLDVYDSTYEWIMSDDDGGIGLNPRIELLAEPDQTYFFELRGYSREENGPYIIWASFESIPVDTERNTERSRAVDIRLGEAIPVFFHTPGESRWYRYEISRNNTVFIIQTRGNLDTLLYLYDSQGNLIAEDDDSGESYYNALIHKRLDAGTYFIEIGTYLDTSGRCTLHAETR